MRCEILMSQYTMIHPGTCCFCVADKQLPVTARFYQWLSGSKLRRHLNLHLREVCWPLTCPHPLCNINIEDLKGFGHHMVDFHGKRLYTKAFDKEPNEIVQSTASQLTLRTSTRKVGVRQPVWTKQDKEIPGLSVFTLPPSKSHLGEKFESIETCISG